LRTESIGLCAGVARFAGRSGDDGERRRRRSKCNGTSRSETTDRKVSTTIVTGLHDETILSYILSFESRRVHEYYITTFGNVQALPVSHERPSPGPSSSRSTTYFPGRQAICIAKKIAKKILNRSARRFGHTHGIMLDNSRCIQYSYVDRRAAFKTSVSVILIGRYSITAVSMIILYLYVIAYRRKL